MGAGKKKGAETVSTQSWIPLSGRNDASRKKCGALVDLDADEKCNANATYLVGEKSWFCDDHDPFKKERLDPAPPPEGAPLEAQDSEGAPKTLWIQLSHKLNKAETEAFKREMDKAQKRIEKCHGFQESQKRCPYKSCYSVGDFWYCANHDPFKGLRPGSAPSPQPSPTDSPRPPKKNKTDSASASKPASPVSIGSSSLGITNRSSTTTTSISIAPNTRPFLEPSNIATEERENHSSQLQGSSTLVSPAASTSVATISTCEGPLPGRDGPAAPLLTQDHVETALQEPSDDNTTNFKSSNLTPDDQQPHHTGADPQLLASQTFHCPHVAITVTTTHITEKEHSVEPAANASAKRSVLDLIMSTFSPAAADPTDENPPTSDGYYFIAICALTGLLIGFIIFCVQKDVEPLAIASVFGTIIGAEGLLLKMYYHKRERERMRRKEAIRQDLVRLCQREDVQLFLRLVSHRTIRRRCKKCEVLHRIFDQDDRVIKLRSCCECRKEPQFGTVSQTPCGECPEIVRSISNDIDAVLKRKNCKCSKEPEVGTDTQVLCGNCFEILCSIFNEDDAVFESKNCVCGREQQLELRNGGKICMKDVRRDYFFMKIPHLYGAEYNFRIQCKNAVSASHRLWLLYKNQKRLLREVLLEASDEITILTELANYKASVFNDKHTAHSWWPKEADKVEDTRLYHLCLHWNFTYQFHSFWAFMNFVQSVYDPQEKKMVSAV